MLLSKRLEEKETFHECIAAVITCQHNTTGKEIQFVFFDTHQSHINYYPHLRCFFKAPLLNVLRVCLDYPSHCLIALARGNENKNFRRHVSEI